MVDATLIGPAWNNGGKEAAFTKMNITMTHDELEAALGSVAVSLIAEAGFVMVPRKWRQDVFDERSRKALASTDTEAAVT